MMQFAHAAIARLGSVIDLPPLLTLEDLQTTLTTLQAPVLQPPRDTAA